MAVSGSRDFIRNRNQLITRALIEVGGISQGETPEDFQIPQANEVLNSMIMSWHNKGIFLWTVSNETQDLTVNIANYTLDAAILDVLEPFIRRDGTDTFIDLITREEYAQIGTKTTLGRPHQIFLDRQLAAITIKLYNVPENSTDVLHFNKVQRLQDFDAATDNPDFPVTAYEMIVWNLALKLTPRYGVTSQLRAEIKEEAEKTMEEFMDSDTESADLEIIPELVVL